MSSHLCFRFSLLFRSSRDSFCQSSSWLTDRFSLDGPHTEVTSPRSTRSLSLRSATRTESVIFVHVVTNY